MQQKHTHQPSCTDIMHSAKMLISPGGGDWSEVFAHRLNDTSTPNPQSSTDSQAAIEQQPDRCGRFLHHPTLVIYHPQGHQRTNCITAEKTKTQRKITTTRIQIVWRSSHVVFKSAFIIKYTIVLFKSLG